MLFISRNLLGAYSSLLRYFYSNISGIPYLLIEKKNITSLIIAETGGLAWTAGDPAGAVEGPGGASLGLGPGTPPHTAPAGCGPRKPGTRRTGEGCRKDAPGRQRKGKAFLRSLSTLDKKMGSGRNLGSDEVVSGLSQVSRLPIGRCWLQWIADWLIYIKP